MCTWRGDISYVLVWASIQSASRVPPETEGIHPWVSV